MNAETQYEDTTYTITDKGRAYFAYSEKIDGTFDEDFPYFEEEIFRPIERSVTEDLVIQLVEEAVEIFAEDPSEPTFEELDDAAEFIGHRMLGAYVQFAGAAGEAADA